jgi:hypothetical protein
MKRFFTRIVLLLVVAELAYVCLANLALNLPLTQSLVNQHRPEKYEVHWDRAWSWYPLRVHVTGISANGQTSSQQWQADLTRASASVSLLPLLQRTVRVSGVVARDATVRLRPRQRRENDYARIRAFFPPVENRDPSSPADARKPGERRPGKPWTVLVEDIRVQGSHDVWVFQIRGILAGTLRGKVSFETKGGPISVHGGVAEVELASLTVNEDREVAHGGTFKGAFDLASFVPSEHRGLKALGFLAVDANLHMPVGSLGFLDYYLRGLGGLKIDGSGLIGGRLSYARGDLLPGTDLNVSAEKLAVEQRPYRAEGKGEIGISVDAADPRILELGIRFGELEARHGDDQVPLFTGEGLGVDVRGPVRVLPDEEREPGTGSLTLTVPSVAVPDLRVYQRYLPEKWGVVLNGGDGRLEGRAEYSAVALRAELDLASEDADIRLKHHRFRSNLAVGLRVVGGASEEAGVDLAGSFFRLDDARIATGGAGESRPWQASFEITRGSLGVPIGDGTTEEQGFRALSDAFKERGFKGLLSSSDARIDASLKVSDLGWINGLFPNPFRLSIAGSGEIAADLRISAGELDKGTALEASPEGLTVRVLDYLAQGAGGVSLTVEKGGEVPDLRLDARLDDALLRRSDEQDAMVEQVSMEVSALATGVSLGGGEVSSLALRIPSARVTDMRVYNQYLPEGSPMELLSGRADLTADILMGRESASGFVTLATDELSARLDEQRVAGRLRLDVRLQDGVPAEMQFDISGSKLTLDGFRVSGEQQSFDQSDWRARFDLHEARVQWRRPIALDVKAGIRMKDSRPIVAMFANQRGKHGFLESIMTVKDISGHAQMHVADDRILVPNALAGSDKIDVGAKALVTKANREGIFYARFRKLKGILKLRNGERNFDLLRARKTFDAYVPGQTPLKLGRWEDETGPDADAAVAPEAPAPRRDGQEEESPMGLFGEPQ